MAQFKKTSRIQASAEKVFAFHEAPDAFEKLQPPWQTTQIVQPPTSLAVGTKVVVRVKVGPLWQTIIAEHIAYEAGRMFADRMVKGPFAKWVHEHIVTPDGPNACLLTDDINYALPMGPLGAWAGGWYARHTLERMFEFRHEVTRTACE